eukprot:Clim_evm15s50 gene=Clim_evmTU15s50
MRDITLNDDLLYSKNSMGESNGVSNHGRFESDRLPDTKAKAGAEFGDEVASVARERRLTGATLGEAEMDRTVSIRRKMGEYAERKKVHERWLAKRRADEEREREERFKRRAEKEPKPSLATRILRWIKSHTPSVGWVSYAALLSLRSLYLMSVVWPSPLLTLPIRMDALDLKVVASQGLHFAQLLVLDGAIYYSAALYCAQDRDPKRNCASAVLRNLSRRLPHQPNTPAQSPSGRSQAPPPPTSQADVGDDIASVARAWQEQRENRVQSKLDSQSLERIQTELYRPGHRHLPLLWHASSVIGLGVLASTSSTASFQSWQTVMVACMLSVVEHGLFSTLELGNGRAGSTMAGLGMVLGAGFALGQGGVSSVASAVLTLGATLELFFGTDSTGVRTSPGLRWRSIGALLGAATVGAVGVGTLLAKAHIPAVPMDLTPTLALSTIAERLTVPLLVFGIVVWPLTVYEGIRRWRRRSLTLRGRALNRAFSAYVVGTVWALVTTANVPGSDQNNAVVTTALLPLQALLAAQFADGGFGTWLSPMARRGVGLAAVGQTAVLAWQMWPTTAQ